MLNEKEYPRIIASNLRRLANEKGIEQKDIADFLGVSRAIVSDWMNAKKSPRMDKVDKLCKFFDCTRSDIIEPYGRRSTKEVTDDQAELIHLVMTSSPENVAVVLALLKRLEGKR